jgi:hypothetical protein
LAASVIAAPHPNQLGGRNACISVFFRNADGAGTLAAISFSTGADSYLGSSTRRSHSALRRVICATVATSKTMVLGARDGFDRAQ